MRFLCIGVLVFQCVVDRRDGGSHRVAWRDLLDHELGQRGDAIVRAVLPQTVCDEALEGQRLLPQAQHDADEVPSMLHGAADDLVPVLRCKQVLRERERERGMERQ